MGELKMTSEQKEIDFKNMKRIMEETHERIQNKFKEVRGLLDERYRKGVQKHNKK